MIAQGSQGDHPSIGQTAANSVLTALKPDIRPEDIEQLVATLLEEDLLFELAQSIRRLPFEARKDTQTIFSYVLRFRYPDSAYDEIPPAVVHIVDERPEILVQLIRGYENSSSAGACGSILRELLRYQPVTACILYNDTVGDEPAPRFADVQPMIGTKQSGDGIFWNLFEYIKMGSFEVSADAFTTLRVRILRCDDALQMLTMVLPRKS